VGPSHRTNAASPPDSAAAAAAPHPPLPCPASCAAGDPGIGSPASATRASTTISPAAVNFTALASRLASTCSTAGTACFPGSDQHGGMLPRPPATLPKPMGRP
jgi:hypothetical protein